MGFHRSPPRQFEQTHFTHAGEGRPVILLHGLAASHYDWDLLVPTLVDKGFECFAPDLLGHGDSAKPEETSRYRIEPIYKQFERWSDHLNFNEKAVLVGHSMGGYLSLLYAIRRPEKVRALILIDPLFSLSQTPVFFELLRRHPDLVARAIQIIPQWLIAAMIGMDPDAGKHFDNGSREQIAADYKRASPYIMYITPSVFDLTPQLSEVATPVLVIWGDKDRTLTPKAFPRLVHWLKNATGYAVRGGGHQPHLSHADEVNPIITDFMRRLDEKRAGTISPVSILTAESQIGEE